jgi:copper chaperone CopZ
VAIFRPIAALVSGIVGGSVVSLSQGDGASSSKAEGKCEDACCTGEFHRGRLSRIFSYGFVTLPRDIARAIIIGLALAGIISVFVPSDFFAGRLGQGITGMLVMMAFGIPIYVCATASVPIAAALIAKGASPGAAIVFLMTGPATNAAAITTIWKIMGKRTALIYLLTVALCALGAGFLLDLIFQNLEIQPAMAHPRMMPGYIKATAAVALLAVLGFALHRPKAKKDRRVASDKQMENKQVDSTTLKISGMTCSHCTKAVKRAILESTGVQHADVDLATASATIIGKGYDIDEITGSIEELGYKVEGKG